MIHIYDNDKQMIAVVHDFISQEECEEILAYSWQNMERSTGPFYFSVVRRVQLCVSLWLNESDQSEQKDCTAPEK